MSDQLLRHKPVNNRKARPAWAMNDGSLWLKCVCRNCAKRFQIAQMYWQKNMTASDIAAALGTTKLAVDMVISRFSKQR